MFNNFNLLIAYLRLCLSVKKNCIKQQSSKKVYLQGKNSCKKDTVKKQMISMTILYGRIILN